MKLKLLFIALLFIGCSTPVKKVIPKTDSVIVPSDTIDRAIFSQIVVTSGGTAYCIADIPQLIQLHKTIDSLKKVIDSFKRSLLYRDPETGYWKRDSIGFAGHPYWKYTVDKAGNITLDTAKFKDSIYIR